MDTDLSTDTPNTVASSTTASEFRSSPEIKFSR